MLFLTPYKSLIKFWSAPGQIFKSAPNISKISSGVPLQFFSKIIWNLRTIFRKFFQKLLWKCHYVPIKTFFFTWYQVFLHFLKVFEDFVFIEIIPEKLSKISYNTNINFELLQFFLIMIPTQARSGDPRQGGAVSVGPIWHTCIAIRPAKHRCFHNFPGII